MFKVPEQYRIQARGYETKKGDLYGAFRMNSPTRKGFLLLIIASCGLEDGDWEHVSVHAATVLGINFTPSWEEMCAVKDLFWDSEDLVLQFHPPKSLYVNQHQTTLHLWRKPDMTFPMPPTEYV